MRLGIMQPYFFPYLGYFDLINRVDRWIVFDTVKYSPRSWMNRNRILHPDTGWQYISVPVDRHAADGRLADVTLIDAGAAWRRIRAQLDHYRHARAPYFGPVAELVDQSFAGLASNRLRDLNVRTLSLCCAHLGIDFDYDFFSEMNLALPRVSAAGQWALEIADRLGAAEYINPPGGREIFDPLEFARRGIRLSFSELVDFRYTCGRREPVEHLSIIDVLMWNPPAVVKAYLDARRDPTGRNVS